MSPNTEIHEFETSPKTYLVVWFKNVERAEFVESALSDGSWIHDNVVVDKPSRKIAVREMDSDKVYYEMVMRESGALEVRVERFRTGDGKELEVDVIHPPQTVPSAFKAFADFRPSGLEVGIHRP